MKSMTGYGKSAYIDEKYEIQIELKSVNSRNFDLKIYNCKELFFLENEIKDAIYSQIKRGKIDIRLIFRDKQIPEIEIDENRLKSYFNVLTQIKDTLSLQEDIKLDTVLSQPDVVVIQKSDYDTEDFRIIFFGCLKDAIKNHQSLAKKEGKAIQVFFENSIGIIENSLSIIKDSIPAHKEKLQENLITAVKQILNSDYTPDIEKRILVETALYIERCDITEELIRQESHLSNIKNYLQKEFAEKSKSMNFIFQEMQREANTISAKYNTSVTFKHVLQMKEEIEKCKEQIQNVE